MATSPPRRSALSRYRCRSRAVLLRQESASISTVALIDRVLHHADVIAIEGESYRRREAEARKNARRKKATG